MVEGGLETVTTETFKRKSKKLVQKTAEKIFINGFPNLR